MKASQSLPRPENWQDFERLCKKLWGEIWNCPEIKKNGRSGQDQAGIDIYGMPNNENSYYGIQCKGKDEYTHKQLTEKEILEEIEKAKKFEPSLKKMYFTTTAVKDVNIETFIRKKNIEHREQNLFEVHIYSWEDIVDLIFENKSTYDYYLNSKNFKTNHSVKVAFRNGKTEIIVNPKFIQKNRISKTEYEKLKKEDEKFINQIFPGRLEINQWVNSITDIVPIRPTYNKTEFNRSLIDFTILIINNGSEPIEHWKLTLDLPEHIVNISRENYEKIGTLIIPKINHRIPDSFIDRENNIIKIEPVKKILVGDDNYLSDPIFLKPIPENITIEIPWKFISKNHKQNGILKLHIEPNIKLKRIKVDDDSPLLLNESTRVTIEDYIESIDE